VAVPFVEKIATQRANQVAQARTIAFCGNEGTIAYSMIGKERSLRLLMIYYD
jgi:hypothetical protein